MPAIAVNNDNDYNDSNFGFFLKRDKRVCSLETGQYIDNSSIYL